MKFNKMEIWKDIPEYEGLYQVSNLGRVKSLDRKISQIRKGKQIDYALHGKIIKQHHKDREYYTVTISKNGNRKDIKVHILVALAFLDKNIYKKIDETDKKIIEVNHKDENKSNNNLDNLEYCTRRYNCYYGTRIEKKKRGDKCEI